LLTYLRYPYARPRINRFLVVSRTPAALRNSLTIFSSSLPAYSLCRSLTAATGAHVHGSRQTPGRLVRCSPRPKNSFENPQGAFCDSIHYFSFTRFNHPRHPRTHTDLVRLTDPTPSANRAKTPANWPEFSSFTISSYLHAGSLTHGDRQILGRPIDPALPAISAKGKLTFLAHNTTTASLSVLDTNRAPRRRSSNSACAHTHGPEYVGPSRSSIVLPFPQILPRIFAFPSPHIIFASSTRSRWPRAFAVPAASQAPPFPPVKSALNSRYLFFAAIYPFLPLI
jgi:hypothetical protein